MKTSPEEMYLRKKKFKNALRKPLPELSMQALWAFSQESPAMG
jgi:hypothetical protein